MLLGKYSMQFIEHIAAVFLSTNNIDDRVILCALLLHASALVCGPRLRHSLRHIEPAREPPVIRPPTFRLAYTSRLKLRCIRGARVGRHQTRLVRAHSHYALAVSRFQTNPAFIPSHSNVNEIQSVQTKFCNVYFSERTS